MKKCLKRIILALFILCIIPFSKAETRAEKTEKTEKTQKPVVQMPQFPGGESELLKFLADNITYPANAKSKGIEGRVVLQFVVQTDGRIGDVKVVNSIDTELDKEAVRVIRLLPAFIPGKMNGKVVDVRYTIPVNFKIPKDKKYDPNVYIEHEQMPQFPGGDAELMRFIAANIIYPPKAKANGVEGRVILQFVVQTDGRIGEIKVARGVDPELDEEAVRIIRLLPAFIPGKMCGKVVNVWYTLPVNFNLKKSN